MGSNHVYYENVKSVSVFVWSTRNVPFFMLCTLPLDNLRLGHYLIGVVEQQLTASDSSYCCLCWLNRIVNCRSWSMMLKREFNSLHVIPCVSPLSCSLPLFPSLYRLSLSRFNTVVNWLYVTIKQANSKEWLHWRLGPPYPQLNVLTIERSSYFYPVFCVPFFD